MVDRHARHLYLARHAEPTDDGSALTERGRKQAALLGERLARVPLAVLHHGPLPRAVATAEVVAAQLPGVPVREHEAPGDYIPHVPGPGEVESAYAEAVQASLDDVTPSTWPDWPRPCSPTTPRRCGQPARTTTIETGTDRDIQCRAATRSWPVRGRSC